MTVLNVILKKKRNKIPLAKKTESNAIRLPITHTGSYTIGSDFSHRCAVTQSYYKPMDHLIYTHIHLFYYCDIYRRSKVSEKDQKT